MALSNELIPVIDFSLFHTDTEECARQVGVASQDIGFFYLKNHGIDQNLIDRMFAQSEKYFAQAASEKLKFPIKSHNTGYSTFMSERLDFRDDANKKGDNKEAFNLSTFSTEGDYADAFSMYNTGVREEVAQFFKSLHHLSRQVLQCFALSLEIPQQDGGMHFFDKSHVWEDVSGTILRFLHYPQQEGDTGLPSAGAHTDYGSLTLLIQNRIPGLEVQANRTSDDVPWVPAPVIPGTILVNIGDLMQMWTNGLLKSTMHRVVYHEMQRMSSRYSIACFIHPSDDVRLDPIPSPVIAQQEHPQLHEGGVMTAKEHLLYKLNATYGNLG